MIFIEKNRKFQQFCQNTIIIISEKQKKTNKNEKFKEKKKRIKPQALQ